MTFPCILTSESAAKEKMTLWGYSQVTQTIDDF